MPADGHDPNQNVKTRTQSTSTRKQNPVEVTITVTKFKDVLVTDAARGGRGTEYTIKLAKRDPRVVIKGDDIYVQRPGAVLRFSVASSRADKNRYYPVGIAFVREAEGNSSDELRLGLQNFPQSLIRLEGRAILITDRYTDVAKYVRYKFSVPIQRGADGKIGIIDPGIIHEND